MSKKKLLESLSDLTKRQVEILFEELAKLDFLEPLDNEASASLSKSRRDYQNAYYGRCWKSEKKRSAFDFLRVWHNAAIWDKESGKPRKDSDRLRLLTPLLNVLPTCENPNRFDAEFFKGLMEAMQILNDRIYNSKNPNMGSGDGDVRKWLLEYKARMDEPVGPASELFVSKFHLPSARYTVRELNQQFVSKFHSISDKKLHEKLHELDIPHKDEPRGKASPKYGTVLNLPTVRRKKGKF